CRRESGPAPTALAADAARGGTPTRSETAPLMVDRNLLRELDVPDPDVEEFDMGLLLGDGPGVIAGGIVPGRVVDVIGDQVVVEVGYKSEGLVRLSEWEEDEAPPCPGDEVEGLLEGMDGDTGEGGLSRHRG